MEGCGGAEKFWSFDPKLPNGPPYQIPCHPLSRRSGRSRISTIVSCSLRNKDPFKQDLEGSSPNIVISSGSRIDGASCSRPRGQDSFSSSQLPEHWNRLISVK